MKLSELYQIFSAKACHLPGFVPGKKEDVEYDIDVLANGYVQALDTKDDVLADQYLSALVIRYWHLIFYYRNRYEDVPLTIEEIFSWICDGISKAAKYRGWLTDPKLAKKKRGAEMCINKTIDSYRAQFFVLSNAQKRKQDYIEDSKVLLDSLEDREAESYLGVEEASYPVDVEIVKSLLKSEQYIDSVVVDLIMNGDCVSSRLSLSKLKDELSSLDTNYFNYFKRKYEVKNMKNIKDAVDKNANLSRFNLSKMLKRLQGNSLIQDLHK